MATATAASSCRWNVTTAKLRLCLCSFLVGVHYGDTFQISNAIERTGACDSTTVDRTSAQAKLLFSCDSNTDATGQTNDLDSIDTCASFLLLERESL
jgi:hypothetical protein